MIKHNYIVLCIFLVVTYSTHYWSFFTAWENGDKSKNYPLIDWSVGVEVDRDEATEV